MDEGATEVGSIVGYLRMDISDWEAALTTAGAKADELARKNPNIRVTATTAEALAQLEAVAVATGRLQDAQSKVALSQAKLTDLQNTGGASATKLLAAKNALAKATRDEELAEIRLANAYQQVDDKATAAAASAAKVGDSANQSSAQLNPLFLAVAALGPGILPVGAAATAAAGAFAGMGAAGILALTGIKTAMTQGTDIGQQYMIVLGDLQSNFQQLGQTAAGGLLGSFQQAVSALDAQMPSLNADVGQFTALAGRIGGNIFTGVIAGLQTMQPMFLQFGTYLDQLAAKFAAWAQSGGFQKFVDYTMANLPNVEATLNALVAAVGRLVIGFVPLGGVVVTALRLVADAINALPIPVVKDLVTAATAGYLAFQAWTAISVVRTAIAGVTTAIIAYDAAQLASTGITAEAAAAQATLGSGLLGMAKNYANLAGAIGLASIAAVAIVAVNQIVSAHMTEVSATATAASAALIQMGKDGQTSQAMMKSFGAAGSDLGKVLEQTFHQSTLDRIKDFQVLGIGTPFTSATKEATNFFKSTDAGLNQMVQQGNAAGANNAFKVLSAEADKQGISVDKLLSKLPQYKADLDLIAATTITAAQAQALLNDQSGVTASSMDAIAAQFNLTSQQASKYATMIGLSADDLANGVVTNQQYATAVGQVSLAYNTATATGDAFLKSLATFSASAGTAADKAALIGAYLVASQGDLLSFSSAVAGGADAFHQMTISFQQDTKDTVLGVKAFRDTEKAAIDLKAGLINLTATGAVPLLQQLTAMQTGAEKAAEATYQFEVGTQGAGKAAADAATIFKTDTYDALVKNAKQLGLTTDQATKLATQYFNMPKTVTTDVQSIGLNDLNTTLIGIGQQLSYLTHQPWTIGVNFNVNAASLGQSVHDAVNSIPGAFIGPVYAPQSKQQTTHRASGGWLGAGDTIVGENGSELIRGGYVYNHAQTVAMLGNKALGSPSAQSVRVSYTTPNTGAGPQTLHLTSYVVMPNGDVLGHSVAEYDMVQARR